MAQRPAIAITALAAVFGCCFAISGCQQPEKTQPVVTVKKPAPIPQPIVKTHDTISIAAVGDMMLGTSYPNANQLPPDSARNSFRYALNHLQEADVTFGNLEGTLYDHGSPAWYKRNKKKVFLFRMPENYGQVFKDAGFDIVSLANNHIGDFADSGRINTVKVLDRYGIKYGGLLQYPSVIFEKDSVKYGFCAFAPNANTLPILHLKNAAFIVSELKKKCDIVIVSFHGGAEGEAFEHVPMKEESYIGERRGDVHAFAHTVIDAGADLVLGNGPHVSRAMELYHKRLIAYSLGNFCTYKSVSVSGVCGLAPLLKVHLNRSGEFLDGKIIAYRQTHADGLVPDTLNRAIKRIKQLTETDFPDAGISIADDGGISRIEQN